MHDRQVTAQDPASQRAGLFWPILLCSVPLLILQFFLPVYAKRLGASTTTIGTLVALFTIVMLLVRPVLGWSIDRFGPKRFFVAGLLCYTAAMAAFAMASTVPILSVAQIIRGMAGALTWIASYTMATHLAASGEHGGILGRLDSASHQGGLAGLVILLVLLSWQPLAAAWQPVSIGLAVLAAIGVGLAWRHAPQTPAPPSRTVTSRPVLSWPVLKVLVIVMIIRGTAALTKPLLLIYLYDTFTTDLRTLLLLYLPAGLIDSFLPTYMGRMSDRVGRISLIAVGMVVSGLATLAFPFLPHLGWFALFAALKALGGNTADPTHRALLGDHLGYQERGTGYGLAEFVGSLATAVTPPLGGWLYDTVGHSAPWYASGLLLCAGAVWGGLFLQERSYRVAAEDCR
jgi:MFS transporter, DHA1 family, multidrug resistance protein